MGTLNRIGIKLTSEQLSSFSDPRFTPFIDTPNSLAVFTLPPDSYAPTYRELGESGVVRGSTVTQVLDPEVEYSIEVQTIESQEAAIEILEAIYTASRPANNNGNYKVLIVWDYHVLDDATARSQGYTVRRMAIDKPKRRSGSIRADGTNYTIGGLSFRLVQV